MIVFYTVMLPNNLINFKIQFSVAFRIIEAFIAHFNFFETWF